VTATTVLSSGYATDWTGIPEEETIWIPPTYAAADWIELCALITPAGTMPNLVLRAGEFGVPIATAAAAKRALILSIAHRMPGHVSEETSSGRRRFVSWQLHLPASERERFDTFLGRALRCLQVGRDWLDGSPNELEFARGHWRAMLLATPAVRNRSSGGVTVRAGDHRQAAALVSSSTALGAQPVMTAIRREERYRIEFSDRDYAAILAQIHER